MRLLPWSRFGSVCPSARPRVASVGLPTGRRCARSTRRAKGRVQWVRRARLPDALGGPPLRRYSDRKTPRLTEELGAFPALTGGQSLDDDGDEPPPTDSDLDDVGAAMGIRRARRGRRRFSTPGIPRAGRAPPPRGAAAPVEDDARTRRGAGAAGAGRGRAPRALARRRAARARRPPTPKTAPTRPPGGACGGEPGAKRDVRRRDATFFFLLPSYVLETRRDATTLFERR